MITSLASEQRKRPRTRPARAAAAVLLAIGLVVSSTPPAFAQRDADAETRREERTLDRLPDWARKRVERFRDATPQEREARREHLLEEMQEATPRERRRLLRRERRLMRALPAEDREKIRAENEAFRRKHDLADPAGMRDLARDLELSGEDRRALRARFRALPREERRALWNDVKRYRSLSEEERAALRLRLRDMRALGEEDRALLRENARRWKDMPEEKRERLREQLRKLRSLSPDERSALLEKALEGVPAPE